MTFRIRLLTLPVLAGGVFLASTAHGPAMHQNPQGLLALDVYSQGETSLDGGATWQAPKPISAPGVEAVQPRVVAVTDGFLVVWSETPPGSPSHLGMSRVPAP